MINPVQKQQLAARIFLVYSFFLFIVLCNLGIEEIWTGKSSFSLWPPILGFFISLFTYGLVKFLALSWSMKFFASGILASIIWSSYLQPQEAMYPFVFTIIPIIISSLLEAPRQTILVAGSLFSCLIIASLLIPEISSQIELAILLIGMVSILIILIQYQRHMELQKLSQTQSLLQKSEEILHMSLDAIGDGAWDWDIAKGIIYTTDRCLEMLSFQRSETKDSLDFWLGLAHPEEQKQVTAIMMQAMQGELTQFESKLRFRCRDGQYLWLNFRGKTVGYDEAGKPLRIVGTITDISNEMAQQLKLMESERMLREAQAIANIGSWYYNFETKELKVTEQIYKIYGWEPDEDIDFMKSHLDHLHHDDRAALTKAVQNCIVTGKPYEYTYRINGPDQQLSYVRVKGRCIQNDEGKVLALQGTCQDVSKTILVQQELERAMQKANQAAEAKANFLANMSHEIRTPLNGLLGYAELLNDSNLNPEQARYLSIMLSAGRHLLDVVNDILDYSKIESGKIQIENKPFPLVGKLQSLLAFHKLQADAKGLTLDSEIASELPQIIVSDEFRLTQVLSNLLSNAIKFTEQGSVKIKADLLYKADHKLFIQIEVEDTGIGIAPCDQSKLFQTFSQVDSTISRKYGGTGLGLVIARNLAKLMGGDLCFCSEVGKGSRFYFTFQAGLANARVENLSEASTCDQKKLKLKADRLRILIVEDNPMNQELAKSYLRKLGFHADVAANGKEAIEAQEKKQYQLIFMDMQMPVLDGLSATKILRKKWSPSELWLVAMTANAMEVDRHQCLTAGMNDFVAKPFSKAEFARAIQHCFRLDTADDKQSAYL